MAFDLAVKPVLDAARAVAAATWADAKKMPYATTAQQVAFPAGQQQAVLPMAVLQVGDISFADDGARNYVLHLPITFHYLTRTEAGGVGAEVALGRCVDLMAALLAARKLGGLVEAVEPGRISVGDHNPVNHFLALQSQSAGLTAASVEVTYRWSVADQ